MNPNTRVKENGAKKRKEKTDIKERKAKREEIGHITKKGENEEESLRQKAADSPTATAAAIAIFLTQKFL